jgi:hypothetical protein
MLNDFSPRILVGCWVMAVTAVLVFGLSIGVKVDAGATLLLLALSLIPPAIILLLAELRPALSPQVIRSITPRKR